MGTLSVNKDNNNGQQNMSTLSVNKDNNNGQQKSPNNNGHNVLVTVFTIISGLSMGHAIKTTVQLFDNGYNKEGLVIALLFLLNSAYAAHQAYYIYKSNNNNNTKQR